MPEKTSYKSEKWVGQRYGRLRIVRYSNKNFECLCDCGRVTRVRPTFLLSGRVKTCGNDCKYHLEGRSGVSKEALYQTWYQMIYRCHNPKSANYAKMQKRKIEVCDEWKNDFWGFKAWAYTHGYEKGLYLTRIKKTDGYNPDNCKWATRMEIAENTKLKNNRGVKYNVHGEMLTMAEVCRRYNVKTPFLIRRLRKGMTMEQAVTIPKYANYTHTPEYIASHAPADWIRRNSGDVTMSTKEN